VLITRQFSVNIPKVVDVVNTLVKKVQIAFKNIFMMNIFVEEEWNIICMKEEFHAKFVAILQILYQRERLTYFSNMIVITFDLANKGQHVN
jgi:hypothetical protein